MQKLRQRKTLSELSLLKSVRLALVILVMVSAVRVARLIPRVQAWSTPLFLPVASRTLSRSFVRATPSVHDDASRVEPNLDEKDQSTSENALTFKQQAKKDRKTLKLEARARRRKFIGLAKAVDRGQFNVTYQPGGVDGSSFQAKSGLPDLSKPFTVLGIESSCDDTGAAIVRSDGVILGEALASQEKIHEEWGGVVPRLASEAHKENIDKVIELALKNANMTVADVDAIGVTVGPGLEVCLRVGCNRARTLAMENSKPFVGIHHLEAHILMTRLDHPELEFPFLALLVSGGHCQILKCLGIGQYSVVGGTVDDSLGEAYDKTARLLNLKVGGGGGPAIEALAREGNPLAIPFSVPLRNRQNCDFSYSGLKSNVRRAAEKMAAAQGLASTVDLPRNDRADLAASFQHVAVKHLEQRLKRAIAKVGDEMKTLAVVGGVAANMEVRSRLDLLCKKHGWEMVVPPPRLCTDQGAMSAWAAVERLRLGSSDDPTDQEVFARYPFASNETQI